MNTLSREQTAAWFRDEEHRQALIRHWKAHVDHPLFQADHRMVYALLMGKDWRKQFSPVTNRRKLENGGWENWGLQHVRQRLRMACLWPSIAADLLRPFDGLVTQTMLRMAFFCLPNLQTSCGEPFWAYPCDAYHTTPQALWRPQLVKESTHAT